MDAPKKAKRGALGAALLAALLAIAGFALTDQITIPQDSHAGDGTEIVEAMTVTDAHYGLLTADPSQVVAAEFDLDVPIAAGGAVWIQPVSEGATPVDGSTAGHWYQCALTGTVSVDGVDYTATASHPVCDTSGTPLAAIDIDQVRVVAAD